jgi:hypothetical protein
MKASQVMQIFFPLVSFFLSFLIIKAFISTPTETDIEKKTNGCMLEKKASASSVPLPWENFPGHFFL